MVRLTNMLMGIMIISLVSLGFMSFYSVGSNEYNVTGYANSSLENFYLYSQNISDIADETESSLFNASSTGGNFDIFGGFFTKVWTALKTTWSSMDTFTDLSNDAVANVGFINSAFSNQLTTALSVMIILVFVVGIFAHFVFKSDRL